MPSSPHNQTVQTIEFLLNEALAPTYLEVTDVSWKHRQHKEAQKNPSKGHFDLTIRSPCLHGKTRLAQHRIVYSTLNSIMDCIHALSIKVID